MWLNVWLKKTLTSTHPDLISWLVCWEVTIHSLVRVTHIPLVAWLSNLSGTAFAASTTIQDRAHTRSTVRSLPTLAGPLTELPPFSYSPPSLSSQLLPIVLSPAETLGQGPKTARIISKLIFFPHWSCLQIEVHDSFLMDWIGSFGIFFFFFEILASKSYQSCKNSLHSTHFSHPRCSRHRPELFTFFLLLCLKELSVIRAGILWYLNSLTLCSSNTGSEVFCPHLPVKLYVYGWKVALKSRVVKSALSQLVDSKQLLCPRQIPVQKEPTVGWITLTSVNHCYYWIDSSGELIVYLFFQILPIFGVK